MISNPSPKRNTHLRRERKLRWRYPLLLLVAVTVLCVSRPPFQAAVPRGGSDVPVGDAGRDPEAVVTATGPPAVSILERTVRSGDTLYDILRGEGLPETKILAISGGGGIGIDPANLVAGRSYRLLSQDGSVIEYQYEPDDISILKIRLDEDPPRVSVEPIPYDVFPFTVTGVISESLFAAVEEVGEKPSLAMDLADIFAWQVDFYRDLRKGDSFTVLVDKYYRDGEFVRYGNILAARFVNAGKEHTGILFTPSGGLRDYFDETGGSLRKQFLKSPLRFRRISSGFSRKRLHPVTGKVTAHLGVDYAAPTGTPVMAIGDGKVVLKRRDPINGRIVKLRHNGTYSSAYAHLSGFARGVAPGGWVRQGQVIGYVGKSGRATGPHLHFAMYRNNRYVDPRRVSVPRATTVPERDMEAFQQEAREVLALLDKASTRRASGTGTRDDVVR